MAAHPLATVRAPKLDERELRPLSEDEERRLLGVYDERTSRDCRIKAIFLVMPPSNAQVCSRLYLPLRKSRLVSFQLIVALYSAMRDSFILRLNKNRR